MRVELRDGDGHEWRRRVGAERAALPRDRCRVVLLAGEGVGGAEQSRDQIAGAVGRSRPFVDEWVGRYRRLGLAGLTAGKAKGAKPTLSAEEPARFKARPRPRRTRAGRPCGAGTPSGSWRPSSASRSR